MTGPSGMPRRGSPACGVPLVVPQSGCLWQPEGSFLGNLCDMDDASSPNVLVREFHAHVGAAIRSEPSVDVPGAERCCRFIEEEEAELRAAVTAGDAVGVADALGDLAYVVYGAALHFGIDLDAVLQEVHRTNMTKTPAGNGKAIKGPNDSPPRLTPILAREMQE